ncbi:kelch domain-containing protein 4 [Bradysia coprophila]|uniref:kelch domain-containing protein 4 n=1 Tax=Bradysia coprophila TaxID=38358 RepID=UPI00187D723D|nr:kelch domain-containing protein 4 [Bradysia coprophila]
MGKKDKNKKKGKGAEKTALKTDKKLAAKQKKLLQKIGEADISEMVAKLEADEALRKSVTETIVPPPSPRSNFSLCAHPDKEELILFGGEFYNGQTLAVYNDLVVYNISKNEWKQVQTRAGPAPRSAHQMVSVANDGGQLWLFGGELASPSQLQFYHYKDLWVYRLNSKTWDKIATTTGPSARSGHRMVAIKKKLFVFGGFFDSSLSYKYFNDVWMFDLETYQWQEINITGTIRPIPRSAGCMAATNDGKILIWGGYSKTNVKKEVDRGVTHGDMFCLAPEKSDPKTWKWTSVKPGGFKPVPRSGVNVAVAPNGKAYIFGGVLDVDEDEENLSGNFSNEMHSIDLASFAWRQIELSGKKDKKKSKKGEKDVEMESVEEKSEVATVSSDGVFTMVVGGSVDKSATVSKIDVNTCNTPSPRMKPGLVVCKGTLYLYGGVFEDGDKQYTLSDFYSIDLHKLDEWKTIIGHDKNAHEWMDSSSEGSSDEDSDDDDDEEDDDSDDSDEMDTD